MVPVLVEDIGVRRNGIEPGVVLEVVAVGIEFILGVESGSVVEDHIHDDCHMVGMDAVHELAEHLS